LGKSSRTRRTARHKRDVPELLFMLRRRYLAGFLFQSAIGCVSDRKSALRINVLLPHDTTTNSP
jgi:hypothetical protein